jgi:hypothetical protein
MSPELEAELNRRCREGAVLAYPKVDTSPLALSEAFREAYARGATEVGPLYYAAGMRKVIDDLRARGFGGVDLASELEARFKDELEAR